MREEKNELRTRLLNKRDSEFNHGNLQKDPMEEIKVCLSDSLIRQLAWAWHLKASFQLKTEK